MATAAPAADAAAAPKKGKKKLLIIVGAVVAALALAGGGAVFMMKKNAAAAEAEEGAEGAAPAKAESGHHDAKAPTFVPLDPFTVNLADRGEERYAQVGITLEVTDEHLADTIKSFMPAIRNNILMALADRTATELADREGKAKLAEQVRRETARAMGYEVEEPDDEAADEDRPKRKKKKQQQLPITAVHFSNFIIQ